MSGAVCRLLLDVPVPIKIPIPVGIIGILTQACLLMETLSLAFSMRCNALSTPFVFSHAAAQVGVFRAPKHTVHGAQEPPAVPRVGTASKRVLLRSLGCPPLLSPVWVATAARYVKARRRNVHNALRLC